MTFVRSQGFTPLQRAPLSSLLSSESDSIYFAS